MQSWQPAELYRLPRHREGAGNDRLAGDDCRDRGKHDQRHEQERGAQPVEDVVRGWRAFEDQGCLARIIQDEARKNERRPGKPDWSGTEMSHVCIERFGTRDAQEYPAENEKARSSAGKEVAEPMSGVDRDED